MPELKQLLHFTTVMRQGSFKRAADLLALSQPTMTKSIAKLEADLKVRLFNRTTRTVEPTDTARELAVAAERVLLAAAAFEDEARLLAAGELGTLRVGAIALATEQLIAGTLARLAISHPKLEVEVVLGSPDVYQDLMAGTCDVVVGDEANFQNSPHARNLRMSPIRTEPVVLVHRARHPLAGDFAALVQQPLAIPSRYYNENHLFNAFAAHGGPEAPRYRLNSLSSCLALVATSDVITLAPKSVAEKSDITLAISEQELGLDIRLVLVTLAAYAMTPAIRAFSEAVKGD